MVVRTSRRLAGFRFEAPAPPLTETLPRMDVAVFVGFAASGPLHTPVAIEDVAQFTAIYGHEAPLVWDLQGGAQVYGYLAPAVRAFFRNGGRRCWIVRVAGVQARSNYFPIPGLAMAEFDKAGNLLRITPAFAQARSEGSWSDPLQVGAALLSRPVAVTRVFQDGLVVDLAPNSTTAVGAGDLLRVTFERTGEVLMLAVESADPLPAASPPERPMLRVTGSRAVWFRTSPPTSPPSGASQAWARVFTHEPDPPVSPPHGLQTLPEHETTPPDFESTRIPAVLLWPSGPDQPLTLDLALPLADAPAPGSLVRVDVGPEQLWLVVADVGVGEAQGSPPGHVVRLTGAGLWLLRDAPHPLPVSRPTGAILTFELWVRRGDEYATRLPDLGFEPGHTRFWGDLPTDTKRCQAMDTGVEAGRTELAFEKKRVEVWRANAEAPFPLAGNGANAPRYVPIAMPVIPGHFLGPVTVAGTPLERDGLAAFHAGLFLDRDMIEASTSTLMAQADFLRYQSPSPRQLRGIHAALGIEEATIIAVPDAVQRGWVRSEPEPPLRAEVSAALLRPEWWHFLSCTPPPQIPRTQQPEWGNFLNCGLRVVDAPFLYAPTEPDPAGSFTLSWSSLPTARYTLEEATYPNFSGAVTLYTGSTDHLVLYGHSQGEYYYRVRAEVEGVSSDWSNGVGVRVSEPHRWQLTSVDTYSADTLLAVQRGLLRMCAARGDVFAVLALPEHFREDDAVAHVATLKSRSAPPLEVGRFLMRPLGFGEADTPSYGAVYHPWLTGREEDQSRDVRRIPPDGTACGVLAARSLARGAWIAPANEVLRGVVALTPPIAAGHRLRVQETQINLIRQEPRGFVALSADTLGDDVDLRPINVRRLLMLLRRLALRLGARYTFEPNDDSFRRLVQRSFEAMLEEMFERGAFAGVTAADAFQVVTSNSLNTPQSVDHGRFIVEIRVRPSLRMTFLTIRLVQTGDRTFVTEGR